MPSSLVSLYFDVLPIQFNQLIKIYIKGQLIDTASLIGSNEIAITFPEPVAITDIALQIIGDGTQTVTLNNIVIDDQTYQQAGTVLDNLAGHYRFDGIDPDLFDVLMGYVASNVSELVVIQDSAILYTPPPVVDPAIVPTDSDEAAIAANPGETLPVADPAPPANPTSEPTGRDPDDLPGPVDLPPPSDPPPAGDGTTEEPANTPPPVGNPTPELDEIFGLPFDFDLVWTGEPVTPPAPDPGPGAGTTLNDLLSIPGLADLLGLDPNISYLDDGGRGYIIGQEEQTPATPEVATEVKLSAPQLAAIDAAAGDIVGLRLENADQGGRIVTFGHVFKEGDVPAGQSLVAIVNGVEVALQIDAKATHADGSLRHGLITMELAAGSPPVLDIALRTAPTPAPGPAVDLAAVLNAGYDLSVELNIGGTVHQIDAAQLLAQALASGATDGWMSGALASEIRVSADVNTDMRVYFDIRAMADGSVKTDVQVAYDWAYETSSSNVTYDAKIIQNGVVIEDYAGFEQNHHSTWRSTVYSGDAPQAHTVYDTGYMIESGAIAAYDLTNKVDEQTVQANYDQIIAEGSGPGTTGLLETIFPSTGGRPDIGVLPSWTVQYLQTMDPRAEAVVLANGDAAGTVPWHIRDKGTGGTIQEADHPDYWYDSRATLAANGNNPISYANTSITPDTAHAPSLSYIPYLITGDRYNLDELKAQDAYNVVNWLPGYRHPFLDDTYTTTDPDLNLPFAQTRGYAWMLRSMANTAWITPDDDAYKTNVEANLNFWIADLIEKFVDGGLRGNAAGELEGYLEGYLVGDFIQPFMQDYAAIAFSQIANMGFSAIDPLIQWQVNFIAGRFLQGDNGFDPEIATAYLLSPFDLGNTAGIQTENGQKLYYSTWAEAFQHTIEIPRNIDDIANQAPGESLGYPDVTSGFVATARASTASLYNQTGDLQALEAFGWVAKQSTAFTDGFSYDPGFNINPVLSDGSILSNEEVHIYTDATEVIATSNASELIHAGDGNDVISAFDGINLVFAGLGNDVIYTGSGDDIIFAGKGVDYIDAGAGNDILKGDAGNAQDIDRFVFGDGAFGNDRIVDFQLGIDILQFRAAELDGISSVNDVANALTSDANGNALLDFGALGSITLDGVNALSLDSSHFILV